jgi:hypothetical protein
MRISVLGAWVVLVCWLRVLPCAAEEPRGFVVPYGLGVNIHFTDPKPGEMEMLAGAGFRIVRMDFAWDATEREKGRYDFSAYDRLLAALEPHKIRAMLIFDYSNRHYDQGLSPQSDEGRRAFARWAAEAAKHFRGHGVVWEMYNEPNIDFWKPKPDVQQYIKLALEVGKALRETEGGEVREAGKPGRREYPREIYVGPATSTIDFAFLEKCFQAGLLDYWSAVSVHPYRQSGPETVAAEYARLRKLIEQYAPKGKEIPILSGEWGYSSAWGKFDVERQGKYLPRQWLINLAQEVPISIWYDWHDDGPLANEPEHHFGTVYHAEHRDRARLYDAKPAYTAAKTLTSMLGGFRFQKRLPAHDADDYLLLFAKGDAVRLAAWTTSPSAHEVVVPLKPGRFLVTDYLGKPLPAVSAGAQGLALTLTDAPQYLVPAGAELRAR